MSVKDIIPRRWGRQRVPSRYGEEHPFGSLFEEAENLFDWLWHGFGIDIYGGRAKPFSPRVDVKETDKEIKIVADIPGLDEKDINVTLKDDVLTIRGEKKEEKEDRSENYYKLERSYGSFTRSIPIPVEVETDKIEAKIKKGVLSVTLPKSPEALKKSKKIEIKSEETE